MDMFHISSQENNEMVKERLPGAVPLCFRNVKTDEMVNIVLVKQKNVRISCYISNFHKQLFLIKKSCSLEKLFECFYNILAVGYLILLQTGNGIYYKKANFCLCLKSSCKL